MSFATKNMLLSIVCLSAFNGMANAQISALRARSEFNASDFVFDLQGSSPVTPGRGGTIRVAQIDQLPSLAKQGMSIALFNLDACTVNLPHVHPRATEMIYVTKGEQLRVAFVEENSGRTLVNDISAGMTTFFPEGLIHYQQNLGCEPVEYVSALNSEDPGVLTISQRTLTLPDEALLATLNLTPGQLRRLRNGLPDGPAKGRLACRLRCKLGG